MSQLVRWPGGATLGTPQSAGPSTILVPPPPPFGGPASIAGLTWWDATALGVTDGTAVGTVTDTSGNAGNSMTQATAGQKPIFHTSIQNGYGGLLFDSASSQFMSTTVAADSTFTVFLVVRHGGTFGDKYPFGMQGQLGSIDGNGSTWYYYPNQASGVTSFGTITPTRAQILCLRFNSVSSVDAFVDKVAGTNLDPSDSYATQTSMYIGQNGAGSQHFDGYVFEVLRYDSALSEADRVNVRDWLWNKYALDLAQRTATDTLGTTDAATRGAQVELRAGADTLGTTDAATRSALIQTRTSADTLATSDAATRTFTRIRTVSDTLGTTDSAARALLLAHAAADTLGTSDVATRAALQRLRTAADTLGTSDSATGFAGKRSAADTLGTSDVATRAAQLLASRLAADTLGTSDAATRAALQRLRSAVDTLGTIDAATRSALLRTRTAADILGTVDATPAPTSIRIADAFNRADENPLFGSGNWATWGYIGLPMQLVSGQATAVSGSENASRWTTNYGLRQGVEVFVDVTGTGANWGQLALTNDDGFTGDGFQLYFQTTPFSGGSTYFRLEAYQPGFTQDNFGTTPIAVGDGIGYRISGKVLQILIRKSGVWSVLFTKSWTSSLLTAYPVIDTAGVGWAFDNFVVDLPRTARVLQALNRIAADTLGTSDAASRLRTSARAATDTLGTTDTALATRLITRFAVDSLGTTDLATRLAILHRVATDVLGTTDAADAITSFVTAPDLYGPLHALVLSDGVLSRVIALDYVAKAPDFEPVSKTVPFEPTQKTTVLIEPHSAVTVTDYTGKAS